MTGAGVTVDAEWALHGKTATDRGYRLLDWSDGTLGKRNFEEALGRYSPGTLERLPQVTMSFLPAKQPDLHYLAIARHAWAAERDRTGRKIELTSFFCMPYSQLAAAAISYGAMHEAFTSTRLPSAGRVPVKVELARPGLSVPTGDELSRQVAALLLTGRPVCVLDAGQVDVEGRLAFIDSVMSLLPYGMRRRMSASTWANPSYREHRFRLFFSSVPRGTGDEDYLVYWGQPERTPLTGTPGRVHDYLVWLEDRIWQPVASLAEQTAEVGFNDIDVLQMLERNGVPNRSSQVYPADADDDGGEQDPSPLPPPAPPAVPRQMAGIEGVVESCADRLGTADLRGLKADIKGLESYLSREAAPTEVREKCRDVIAARHLLAPQSDFPSAQEASLYDALLRLAFGRPLTYEAYCQVEDCLGEPPGTPPHHALLEAIERGDPQDARVLAIVQWYLGGRSLNRSFRSGQLDVRRLVAQLAEAWPRPYHARIVCQVTLQYLRTMNGRYEAQPLADLLHGHGYLAPALQRLDPQDVRYQVNVLADLLQAVYSSALDRVAVSQILAGSGRPPTMALLIAVLRRISDPADARAAWEDYLRAAIGGTNIDLDTRSHVETLLGHAGPAPGPPAPDPAAMATVPVAQIYPDPPQGPADHGAVAEGRVSQPETRQVAGVTVLWKSGNPEESEADPGRNR